VWSGWVYDLKGIAFKRAVFNASFPDGDGGASITWTFRCAESHPVICREFIYTSPDSGRKFIINNIG
jgi:hypothetical protein